MSLWEMDITQTDCPHIRVSRKYAHLRIVIMGTEVAGKYERLFSIFSSANERQLNDALNFFQDDCLVRDFKLLSTDSGIATAFYLIPQTSMFRKISSIGLRVHPIIVKNGSERWHVITDQTRHIINSRVTNKFTRIQTMRKKKPAELFRAFNSAVRYLMPAFSIADKLSARDIELIRTARQMGFFSWPRRTTLTSLSRKLDVPKSTLSYHFRAVEEKIAEALT